MLADGFTDGLAAVVIDATAPTASISATGHAYNAATGILTIVGSQLDTLGIAVADPKPILWSWEMFRLLLICRS